MPQAFSSRPSSLHVRVGDIYLLNFLRCIAEISEGALVTAVEGARLDVLLAQVFIVGDGSPLERVSATVHHCKSRWTDAYLGMQE